jgi:type I restriction enzyme S subunit
LASYEFDLPSLAEQKVLAEKLWAAYEVKLSYLKMIAATEEMVKSQFIEMFYNEKYPLQKLKTHIDVIRGVSYKPVDIKEETSDSISVILRSNNISNGQINFDDVVYVDNKRVTTEQVLSKGDIVMCGSNGSKKLVGKAAMINTIPSYRTSFGAFCLGIRCKESILPEYLSAYFQTPKYREVIEFLGSGSNILNIKPEHIYNLEIPIPSLEDQKHFVTIAEQADKSGFELRKSVDAIDKVIKSLINENL